MRGPQLSLLLGCLSTAVLVRGASRPQGVGPEFAKFYKSTNSFTCISNPNIQLSIAQVNDDYCDCPDGSDEPGTSACSYISVLSPGSPLVNDSESEKSALALPGFHCKNKGHRAAYIPFAQVNDGVCDYERCCDGSDEWKHVGGVVCVDRCKAMGKEWRKQDEARKKGLGAALKKKREMLAEAKLIKGRLEDSIAVLVGEVQTAEGKVAELKAELEEVERREKSKVVKGRGGKVNVLAELARDRIEELRDALVSVRSQRDVARGKMQELEKLLSTFKEEYDPTVNDEVVKRVVQGWDEYVGRKDTTVDLDMSAHEGDLDEIVKPDGEVEGGINWADWLAGETESDVDLLYNLEAYLPASLRSWIKDRMQSLQAYLVSNGIVADSSSSSSSSSAASKSKAVTDARNALTAAQSSLSKAQSQLTSEQQDLEADYGPDDMFRAVKGQCVSTDSGEYTYELCFMQRTTQKPNKKNGGGDTSMGSFVRFGTLAVDDDDDDDHDDEADDADHDGTVAGGGGRRGTATNRVTLLYEHGQQCWNGPARSTLVVLACAESLTIAKVVEQEKCVYRMEVGIPLVCQDGRGRSSGGSGGRGSLSNGGGGGGGGGDAGERVGVDVDVGKEGKEGKDEL